MSSRYRPSASDRSPPFVADIGSVIVAPVKVSVTTVWPNPFVDTAAFMPTVPPAPVTRVNVNAAAGLLLANVTGSENVTDSDRTFDRCTDPSLTATTGIGGGASAAPRS